MQCLFISSFFYFRTHVNINSKRQTEEAEKNTTIENIVQQILPDIACTITDPQNMHTIKNYKKCKKLYAWAKGIISLFDLAKSDQIRGNSEDTTIKQAYTVLTELLKDDSQNDTNNVTHSKAQPNLNDINKKSNISNKSTSTNQLPNKESRKTPSNKGFHATKEGIHKEEKNKKPSTPPQSTSFFNSHSIPLIIGGTIITLGGLYGAYKMLKTSQTYTS